MSLPLKSLTAEQHSLCPICHDSVESGVGHENFRSRQDGKISQIASHVFHSECFQGWWAYKHTCPTCRVDLKDENHLMPGDGATHAAADRDLVHGSVPPEAIQFFNAQSPQTFIQQQQLAERVRERLLQVGFHNLNRDPTRPNGYIGQQVAGLEHYSLPLALSREDIDRLSLDELQELYDAYSGMSDYPHFYGDPDRPCWPENWDFLRAVFEAPAQPVAQSSRGNLSKALIIAATITVFAAIIYQLGFSDFAY